MNVKHITNGHRRLSLKPPNTPNMNINELINSFNEAVELDSAINRFASRFAKLLVGRLRHCDGATCAELKRELAKYNIHTRMWN